MVVAAGLVLAAAGATWSSTPTGAVLTDQAQSASARAVAGAFSLAVEPGTAVRLDVGAAEPVVQRVTLAGTTAGDVRLSLAGPGAVPCADLPALDLRVLDAGGGTVAQRGLCSLTTEPLGIGLVDPAGPGAVLRLAVVPAEGAAPGPASWTGVLRLTAAQSGGGFRDQRDLDVTVSTGPAETAPAEADDASAPTAGPSPSAVPAPAAPSGGSGPADPPAPVADAPAGTPPADPGPGAPVPAGPLSTEPEPEDATQPPGSGPAGPPAPEPADDAPGDDEVVAGE